MSRHAFAAYGVYVAPRFRPKERISLDDIGGTGISLIALTHGLLKNLELQPFRNDKSKEYFSVDEVDPAGCRVNFTAEYGKFGMEGNIRNTQDHSTTHSYSMHESPVVSVRNMVLSPPRSKMALCLAERYGNRGAGSFFIKQLENAFRARFGGELLLHSESLIDNEAWQRYRESAKLTGIKVVRYKSSHDLADDIDRKLIGRMEYEVKPIRGIDGFGNYLKSKLLGGELKAQGILGLVDVQDDDETRLTLDDGDQQRQVVLGREQLPALVYLIDYQGQERAKDDVIYAGMRKAIPSLTGQLQVELPSDWDSAPWTAEQLAVRMGVVRER